MIITLLSDFGDRDNYVGVMKGAIARINPAVTIIDLTHQIPPQDLAAARFNLMTAYPYFPAGTVHVAVVDPGVGSQRRAIAIQVAGGVLVGPDNGIFSGVLEQNPAIAVVELNNPAYWRTSTPSSTFHGRDIFAPVGAHLALGRTLWQLGTKVDPGTLVSLPIPSYRYTEGEISGCIQYIDRFGNLVTTIPASIVEHNIVEHNIVEHNIVENNIVTNNQDQGKQVQNKPWSVTIASRVIAGKHTYAEVGVGDMLALGGSHGWVEIAVNGGNAQSVLQIDVGAPIELRLTDEWH